MKVNGVPVEFKVDTGAAVTALPTSMMQCCTGKLQVSDKVLKSAGNNKLKVSGKAEVLLQIADKEIQQFVYFVEGLVMPLLGKPAIDGLDMIRFVDCISLGGRQDWKTVYPNLFKGLGTMGTEVKIQIKEDAVPFVQTVPRRVAAARKKPLQEELSRMERLGVIEKVEDPTDWCSPCVVVPKKNGKIRVCIDFTKLNRAVKREYYPLQTSDETLSALGNA